MPAAVTRRPRVRFDGWIAGMEYLLRRRIVLGHWLGSSFGAFSDVMLEWTDHDRLLLAPTRETADFISGTYVCDTVRVVPLEVSVADDAWTVTAGPLDLRFTTGPRGLLCFALRTVPGALARLPAWSPLTDRPARLLLPGVRTRGSTGRGRRDGYVARDLLPIRAVSADYGSADLGAMAPVEPPVRFGFGSAPRNPSLTLRSRRRSTRPGVRAPGQGYPAGTYGGMSPIRVVGFQPRSPIRTPTRNSPSR